MDEESVPPYILRRREKARLYYHKNHDRVRAQGRAYDRKYRADPVKRAKENEKKRAYMKSPARRQRIRQRRESLRVALAGRLKPDKCEICSSGTEMHFDHCHLTGRFRGWICERCNRVLGMVKDNSGLLRSLAAYLEQNDAVQGDFVALLQVENMLKDRSKTDRPSKGKGWA